jgi:hypothetical protein
VVVVIGSLVDVVGGSVVGVLDVVVGGIVVDVVDVVVVDVVDVVDVVVVVGGASRSPTPRTPCASRRRPASRRC